MFWIITFINLGLLLVLISYIIKQTAKKYKSKLDQSTRTTLRRFKRKLTTLLTIKKHSYYNALLFNDLFIIFFEGYIEIILSGFLNLKGSKRETKSDEFSFVISYVFGFVCLVIVPISLIYMLSQSQATLESKDAIKSYGSLYNGLST